MTDEQRSEALRTVLARSRELDFEPGEASEFMLWRDSLEADNFTVEEICEVVNSYAKQQDLEGFALDPAEVNAKLNEQGQRNREQRKGFASVVVDLCDRAEPQLRLGKPELARMLARFALAHPELGGERRGILDLAENLYMLASVDRRLPD